MRVCVASLTYFPALRLWLARPASVLPQTVQVRGLVQSLVLSQAWAAVPEVWPQTEHVIRWVLAV